MDSELVFPDGMNLTVLIHEEFANANEATSRLLESCSGVICNDCKHSKFRIGFGPDREIFYLTGNFFCSVFLKNTTPFRCKHDNGKFGKLEVFDTTFGCGAYEEPETPSKLEQAAKLLEKR